MVVLEVLTVLVALVALVALVLPVLVVLLVLVVEALEGAVAQLLGVIREHVTLTLLKLFRRLADKLQAWVLVLAPVRALVLV